MATTTLNLDLNKDAFYRYRISEPQTIFDSKQIYDNQPLFWDDQETSGGGTSSTYNTDQASTTLAVGNLTAGTRTRQTFRRFDYQPGKSQLAIMTGIIGASATGITSQIGQFDDNNGLFFEMDATGFGVVVRTYTSGSPVDTRVAQASFNIDKMDGTGDSGITLDFTKTQIYYISYEWLGVGSIWFGTFINGVPYNMHRVDNANSNTLVYMSTPNLPLRYSINNDGTGAAASLLHICSTVITEGGRQDTGVQKGLPRDGSSLTTLNDTNIYPLIGIRLKSTHLGALINVIHNHIICTSTAEYVWYIILNPSIVGDAPSWQNKTNSAIQYCYPTNTTTITGGEILDTGLGSDTNQSRGGTESITQSDLVLGSAIDGTPDEIYLAVKRVTGTTETFWSTITFKETN